MNGRLPLVIAALGLASCTALPWGQGGAEPMGAQRGALIRVVGPDAIQVASDRLGAVVEGRLGGTLPLAPTTLPSGNLAIRWEGLGLTIGRPSLELAALDAAADDPGLRLHVPVEASRGSLTIVPTSSNGEALCAVPFEVSAARLTLRLSLAADKLGRMSAALSAAAPVLAQQAQQLRQSLHQVVRAYRDAYRGTAPRAPDRGTPGGIPDDD